MRQTSSYVNHFNRQNYEDTSSYKVRPPANQQFNYHHKSREHYSGQKSLKSIEDQRPEKCSISSFYEKQQYRNQPNFQIDYKCNDFETRSNVKDFGSKERMNSYQTKQKYQYLNKENSRSLSHNSKGSNSIKMSDYVALQAKNLINNKEKFNYQDRSVNHMRSSSLQCYPNSFKVTRTTNYEHKPSHPSMYPNQPTQIPSFGIQCRTTMSSTKPQQKRHSVSKYPPTMNYRIEDPSKSRNIQSQLDQRIQRLRASSSSTRHRERINSIEVMDQNRLDNMDKINIKIKNILTTLEKEQNHYKEKFQDKRQIQNTFQDRINLTSQEKFYNLYEQVPQPSQSRVQINPSQHYRGRIKTQNDFFQPSDHGQLYYHHRRREKTESDLSATQLKYQKSRQSPYYPHSKLTYHQEPLYSKPSHTDHNVSSFYYYEDEQAILKSSQSLMTTSPEKSFKRHSAEKYVPSPKRQDSYNSRIKHSNSINPTTTHNHYQAQNEYQKTYTDECKMTANLLKNIPECQTELIESNAFEFASEYNTFKQQHHLERQFNNYKLSSHTFQKPFNPSQSSQHSPKKQSQDYRTPHLAQYSKNHQLQTFKITESHEFSNKVNHITFKNDTFLENEFTESLNNQANFGGKAQCKKTNLIYFKPEEKEKYLKSTHRQLHLNESPTMGDLYPSSLDPQIKHQFTLPRQTLNSYDHKITQPNQYPKHPPLPRNKYDNCYSDSIKQTPRIDDQAKSPRNQSRIKSPKNQSRIKQSQIQSDVLNEKLKEYQERIFKHQQDMINSNLFESHRTMSPLPTSTQKSRLKSLSKSNQKEQIDLNQRLRRNTVSQFKSKNDEQKSMKLSPKNTRTGQDPQRPQLLSQQNLNSLLQNLKKQRTKQLQLVSREKNSKQNTNSFKNLYDANINKNRTENPSNKSPRNDSKNKSNNGFSRIVYEQRQQLHHQSQMKLQNRKFSDSRFISTPPKYSPRHKNAKNDHSRFIQNLRKQRQQVSKLSHRKSRLQNSTSVEIYGQRNRSESQNSHISSTTIIKGKNIDEQISKIQRKMQQFQQMKKQLHLQSQQNTQRSVQKDSQTRRSSVLNNNQANSQRSQQKDSAKSPKNDKPPTPTRNSSLKKSPKYSKNIQQYQSTNSNNRPKTDSKSPRQTPKSKSLLKVVAEENSFCKVRKSIIKQHKTNEIKEYLNGELSRQNSARSHQSIPKSQSASKKKQDLLSKSRAIKQTKQNLPPTTTTIDSPKYSNGQKKVVFGLAQNLILNECAIQPSNIEQPKKTDVKTPKLLRNFKNKPLTNDASLIKKKAQKRGFRSQFINDLHEDNEVLCSAKKTAEELTPDELQNQTSSRLVTSQNREILSQILSLIEQQIEVDERFRNEKKMFNALTKKDKWAALMAQYTKKVPQNNVLLSDIVKIFTLNEEQNNPFYSTRGVSFTLESLVQRFIQTQQSWKSLLSYFTELTSNQLTASGFNSKALDVQRKNFISIDDLTRFINMELNKYYRNRDLWLIWQRLFESTSNAQIQLFQVANEKKLSFQQVLYGFGVFN